MVWQRMIRVVVTVGVFTLIGIGALGATALAQTAIGLGVGLFFADGSTDNVKRVGPSRDANSTKNNNCDVLSGSIWCMQQVTGQVREGFRVGGGLTYRGSYGIQPDNEDDDVNRIGTLLEIAGRGEWTTELAPKLAIGFGFELGLAMVFVGDDLEDTVEALQAQGVDTGLGPRLGFTVGPSVIGRYAPMGRLHAPLDVGIHWQSFYLLSLDETVHGLAYEREQT